MADSTKVATFVNTKNLPPTGSLKISKTITGTAADLTKKFIFTFTLNGVPDEDADNEYTYIGHNIESGQIKSGDTFSLGNDQNITIVGIPKDAEYTIAEADYSSEGYVAVSTGAVGTIVADSIKVATFVNTKNLPLTGSLKISKTVKGDLGDYEKEFDFVVNLGTSGVYNYTGSKTGVIENGQTISLKDGEYIVINGLPVGTTYWVVETEANQNGYVTSSENTSGEITEAGEFASFINTKGSVPKTGDNNSLLLGEVGLLGFSLILLLLIVIYLKLKQKGNKKSN